MDMKRKNPKVSARCALTSTEIVGPVSSPRKTIDGDDYLDMLKIGFSTS
jgi:hypothetical protein